MLTQLMHVFKYTIQRSKQYYVNDRSLYICFFKKWYVRLWMYTRVPLEYVNVHYYCVKIDTVAGINITQKQNSQHTSSTDSSTRLRTFRYVHGWNASMFNSGLKFNTLISCRAESCVKECYFIRELPITYTYIFSSFFLEYINNNNQPVHILYI